MTVSIEVCFPWGRAHATPWGRHPNEGAVEWPPAPRRLLRALFAAWKTREPDLAEGVVLSLLEKLAVPPTYGSDEVRAGSTRHYLPDDRHTSGRDRNLALDAFVSCRTDRGLIVSWDCELTDDEHDAFTQLVAAIPFLGRADSIVQIGLTDATTGDRPLQWAPLDADDGTATDEIVDLLVVDSPLDVEALTATPAAVRSTKRLTPASSRVISYKLTGGEQRPASGGRARRRARKPPTAIRFLLDGRSNPHPHQSLSVAHLLRQAAMKIGPDQSSTLSGRQSVSTRRQDQHRHAHYLVFATETSRLDTAVIWAPEGLDDDHVRRLTALQWLRSNHLKEVPPMRTIVEGVGDIESVAPELCGPARVWRSTTPFSITRYPKDERPLEDHVAEQVQAELARRALAPGTVTVSTNPDWRKFRRHRPGGRSMRSARPARQVAIEFDETVTGPVAIGALSHFSLGLFLPGA